MRPAHLGAWLATCCLAVACGTAEAPTPVPTSTPTTAATAAPVTPAPTSNTALPAPANVRLTGRIPDTSATVPPGEGEAGRLTIEWDAVAGAEGYRIYERDCAGAPIGRVLQVGAAERGYGPLQVCRPGGKLGVSAWNRTGESPTVWVP